MLLDIPTLRGKDLFQFLIENEKTLIAQKKYEIKRADAISYSGVVETARGRTVKAGTGTALNKDEITVTSVINTTKWYDSHGDVHIDGLWKKTLSENKTLYLLQEHNLTFKGIISDQVQGYTKNLTWHSLGVNKDGYTEALVFDSLVKRERNPYMFDQYSKGFVKNHSVGMRYVNLDLAINDEEFPKYKKLWDKYIDDIANKDDVEEAGYFWPITEAKAIEGSAVPIGSNIITPTQEIKNIEPPAGTQTRAADRTRVKEELKKLLLKTKNLAG